MHAAEILVIWQIFPPVFRGRFSNTYFSELNGATYAKFGEDISQSSTFQEVFKITDMLLYFVITAHQSRLGSKTEVKFRTFTPSVKKLEDKRNV